MLGVSMTSDEIDKLTKMTEFEDSPDFNVGALAEFAKWLKRYGPDFSSRYKNMEYKGPRFWFLAHTSMAKWQMAIIQHFYLEKKQFAPDIYHKDGFLWSGIEPLIKRKLHRGYHWPHTENTRLGGLESDFYVKPLLKKVAKPKEEDKEFLDL
jgi:hypothetical protein